MGEEEKDMDEYEKEMDEKEKDEKGEGRKAGA